MSRRPRSRSFAAMTDQQTRGGAQVDAGGIPTYYEVRGAGEPVILLHGGMCTAETFDAQASGLAGRHRVYVPERRGHGRTPDVEGPITYENMADDTIAFMEAVGLESAHLVGWSDGALVGLLVAMRRPELVRKLVLIGQYLNLDGAREDGLALMQSFTAATFPPMFRDMYGAVSPDGPEHFDTVFDKLAPLWRSDPGIALADLAGITTPTLVLAGDDDVVTVEHAAAVARALPDAQLAIVPGTSHALPMEKPELVNRLVLDFLADEQPPKMLVISEMLAAMPGR
jgi:pimeloyl-ACP methyl ester carboxylesterase